MSEEIIQNFNEIQVENMEIELKRMEAIKNCLLLVLKGSIDTYNAIEVQKKINILLQTDFIHIIFDLSEVTYLSSTGAGVFIQFLEKITAKQGCIVFIKIGSMVKQTFQTLGFSNFFKIEDTLEAALDLINMCIGKKQKNEKFPISITCPVCANKQAITKAGLYKCPNCTTSFEINESGMMSPI